MLQLEGTVGAKRQTEMSDSGELWEGMGQK